MNTLDNDIDVFDKSEQELLLSQCFLSTRITAKILFPDRFYLPFSSLHEKIFEVLDNDSIQKAVIIAPRGFGKTSCVNLAYPGKKILFQEKKFIVPISNTATQAVMQGENLKRELLQNRMITRMFGSMKSDSFSKEMWITSSGIAVLPRGSGQQVRGILHGDHRPDLIICDDLEDTEGVKSEEQRKKLKEWFFADVLNSVNRARSDWKIIVIGSLLHEASLLADLLDDDSWHHVHLSLCDDKFHSNWPDFMNDSDVLKLAESFRKQGLLDSFYREYMGIPVSLESRFRKSYFKWYQEDDNDFLDQKKKLENIVLIDPAKTTEMQSAESAIVGVGVDIRGPKIYVRDIVAGKFHPDEIYKIAFDMADALRARVIGIEVTSLNEFITYPMKTLMIQQKRNYEIVELKARASKEDRIAMLLPFYRMGYIYHNSSVCSPLEAQLLSYPRSKRWDVMDAFAYVVEILEMGGRYFIPEDDDESQDEFDEKNFDDLTPLKPMEDWRSI